LADVFSDLHITLLKSVRHLLAAFQKSFVKNLKMYLPIERRGLNSKENSECTPGLQKSFVNSKDFRVKQLRTYYFNITLKGEFKK
jgi:hypothetical protein